MSEIALKPTTLAATLKALIPQRTLCINVTGQPGIGKSAIVKQVAQELEMNFIDIRAVLLDPVDFRGVPSVEGGRTKFNPPDFLPKAGCGKTVLFFDEVDKAPSLTQCGLLQITLDRRLGEYELPDEVTIVSAMNRQGDRAGSQKLNTALANRFVHLNLMADKDQWKEWAVEHEIHQSVRAYLDFRPNHITSFDPSRPGNAFASPRSWEFLSTALKAAQASGVSGEGLAAIIAGCIGDEVAVEFSTFLKVYDQLPDIDAMLKKPAKKDIPKEASVRYAVVQAIVDKLRNEPDKLRESVATLMTMFPAEYALLGIRDCSKAVGAKFAAQPVVIQWVKDNTSSLMK